MNIMQGSFVVLDLGTANVKYLWKGTELAGVVKIAIIMYLEPTQQGIAIAVHVDQINWTIQNSAQKEFHLHYFAKASFLEKSFISLSSLLP